MKYLILPFLLLAMPSIVIAENIPANYMIFRGKLYNLDSLWGKGSAAQPTAQTSQPTAQPVTIQSESREVRANMQRVNFRNAENQLLIELLRNSR